MGRRLRLRSSVGDEYADVEYNPRRSSCLEEIPFRKEMGILAARVWAPLPNQCGPFCQTNMRFLLLGCRFHCRSDSDTPFSQMRLSLPRMRASVTFLNYGWRLISCTHSAYIVTRMRIVPHGCGFQHGCGFHAALVGTSLSHGSSPHRCGFPCCRDADFLAIHVRSPFRKNIHIRSS